MLYFRLAIPADLHRHFNVKSIYKSLKTAHVKQTIDTVQKLKSACLRLFNELRNVEMNEQNKHFEIVEQHEWTVRGAIEQRLIEQRMQNGPPHQAIYCSQMVIEAYEAGIIFPNDWVKSGVFSPNDMLIHNIFQYQGFLSMHPVPRYHPLAVNADIPRLTKRAWTGSWLRFARACLRPRK